MNRAKCVDCKHWKRVDESKMGLCGKLYADHERTINPGKGDPIKDIPKGMAIRPKPEPGFRLLMGESYGCVHWAD